VSDARPVVRFVIPGEPVGQPRPRPQRNGSVQNDTPESKAWKRAAKEIFAARLAELGLPSPLFPEGPVALALVAAFSLPAGEHRKRTVTPRRWHVAKPDIDNILKAPMDAGARARVATPKEAKTARGQAQRQARHEEAVREAARGLLWGDDSQVCACHVYKICCAQDEVPFVEVTVGRLGPGIEPFMLTKLHQVVDFSFVGFT
jgi:Holliday junction resolvase RusA-like endonuclease